jgi:hypothetical protein
MVLASGYSVVAVPLKLVWAKIPDEKAADKRLE